MKKFGYTRLFKDDVSPWRKVYFKVFGVSPDHRLRFMYMQKLADGELSDTKAITILDAGCGSGDYSFYLGHRYPRATITSIDIDAERVSQNIKMRDKIGTKNINFQCRDLATLIETEKYDFICCIDVLEHLHDVTDILSRLLASLKKNGYLYIHLPLKKEKPAVFHKHLADFHDWAEHEHVAEPMTKQEFMNQLTHEGCLVVKQRSTFNHYLGELSVSLIMLFYKDTKINNLMKALLSPLMALLVNLEVALWIRSGNAVAVLARKA